MGDVTRAIFVALMTAAAEIFNEKGWYMCAVDSELKNFLIKGFYRQGSKSI